MRIKMGVLEFKNEQMDDEKTREEKRLFLHSFVFGLRGCSSMSTVLARENA
jgi:hypothetical protein